MGLFFLFYWNLDCFSLFVEIRAEMTEAFNGQEEAGNGGGDRRRREPKSDLLLPIGQRHFVIIDHLSIYLSLYLFLSSLLSFSLY